MKAFAAKMVSWKSMCKSLRFCAAPTSYDVMWLATDYGRWEPSSTDLAAGITKPAFPHRMDCTSTLRSTVINQIYKKQILNRPSSTNDPILSKADIINIVNKMCNIWNLPHTHDALDDALHQGLEHCMLNRIILSNVHFSHGGVGIGFQGEDETDDPDKLVLICWDDEKITVR